MDLWIRSQDKSTLLKINYLYVNENDIHREDELLGTYKSKERALEVLDEINEIKYYKYMASLDWNSFVSSILKLKSEEEKNYY